MSEITVNARVRTKGSTQTYRVVALAPVFGIPAADLIRLRKDGSDAVHVRKQFKNLPLSVLEVVR